MPRNSSGTYTLPSAPFVAGTTISSAAVNLDFSDIATALTGSVAADGTTPITGALKGIVGSSPAFSFSSDTNTGFGSDTADTAYIMAGGTQAVVVTATGATLPGTITVTGGSTDPWLVKSTDTGTSLGPYLDLYRDKGTPAVNDYIGAIIFNGRDSVGNKQQYAGIVVQILSPTSGAGYAGYYFYQHINGSSTAVITTTSTTLTTPLIFANTNVTKAFALTGGTTAQRSGGPTAGDIRYNTTLNGLEYWNGTVWIVLGQAPTVQRLTSGSGNYSATTSNVVRVKVRMCGGGGGGGALNTNNGSNGADTTFGGWTATKGSAGSTANAATGGAGGTGGSAGSGTLVVRVDGGNGNGTSTTQNSVLGGQGGSNPFGGAGAGILGTNTGLDAKANTGGGGGGAGASATSGGSGGGAGEYVEFWATIAQATGAAYSVGAGGAGGTAGTRAGGAGAAGIIIIEEFYS